MRVPLRLFAAGTVAALLLTACGSSSDPGGSDASGSPTAEAPGSTAEGASAPVVVGGFNFPESSILVQIYAQALENAGVDIEAQPNLGTRELVKPALTSGDIDIVPEYVGSAISVGFGETPDGDLGAALQQLSDLYADDDVTVLEPSDAQDRNVFVVTSDFAQNNNLSSIGDLGSAGDLTLAGGPECEARETCFAGLQSVYGLGNLTFTTIQEKAPRLASLRNGDVQVILLFSTDPVFTDGSLVALEDPMGMTPPENVVPVVRQEILDANPVVSDTLNKVSAALTTEALANLNAQAGEGQQPEDIAAGWLSDNDLAG